MVMMKLRWQKQLAFSLLFAGILIVVILGLAFVRETPTSKEPINFTIATPDQSVYQADSDILKVITFVSGRWATTPNNIVILTVRKLDTLTDIGLVNINSLASAEVLLVAESYQEVDKLNDKALAYEDRIFLWSEFVPQTAQQLEVASSFYSTTTPSISNTLAFAVILTLDIDSKGDGKIKAFTSTLSNLIIPVEQGKPRKDLAHHIN